MNQDNTLEEEEEDGKTKIPACKKTTVKINF
jgi:hypothetical protein